MARPSRKTEKLVTLYARFADRIAAILDDLEASGKLPAGLERRAIAVEPPRDPAHGDLATNAAMGRTRARWPG
jgi:arginyl-tRNA synthetase